MVKKKWSQLRTGDVFFIDEKARTLRHFSDGMFASFAKDYKNWT